MIVLLLLQKPQLREKSFKDNEILIIGGQPKNIGFDDLAEVITETNNIKKVIVIGEATPKNC